MDSHIISYPKVVGAALSALDGIGKTIITSNERGDWRRLSTENHVAMVCNRRGHVIAIAWNKAMTRSKGSGASAYTMHAEIAVIKKLGNLALLRNSVLVVARFTRGGRVRASSPCSECRVKLAKMFELYGLKGGGLHHSRSVH
jgi:hypothetical protein